MVTMGLRAWNDQKAVGATDAIKESAAALTICTTTSRLAPDTVLLPSPSHKGLQKNDENQGASGTSSDSAGGHRANTGGDVQPSEHGTPPDLFACPFYKLDPAHFTVACGS